MTDRPLIIITIDLNLSIVIKPSLVNSETWFISLKSDTVSYFSSEEHFGTLHEVIHYVLKLWLKSFLIDKIESNFFISSYLKSNIAFNKEDRTSNVSNGVVFKPIVSIWVLFKEGNRARRPGNESLVKQ